MRHRDGYRRAFLAAQRAGLTTFEYDGTLYPVQTRDENDPVAAEVVAEASPKSAVVSGVLGNGGAGQVDYFAVAALPYNTEPEMQW